MAHDIIGDWEVSLFDRSEPGPIARLTFFENDRGLAVTDSDPDEGGAVAHVELDGETLRFEHVSARSARGMTRHTFEIVLQGPSVFTGTRRRGMLARVPITGARVVDPLDAIAGNLAEAKAKAADAAERAAMAAAEAAAALAEAEAAAALEAARRAAQKAVAARAAAAQAGEAASSPLVVPREVLAIIPAPAQPASTSGPPAPASAAPASDDDAAS